MEFKVTLKPWQDRYIFSPKRYPGMFSSWGTGKSLSMILRAMIYSKYIPNNLGIIFRKEFTDLRDSTCKDFERYTGLKINSGREVVLPNGSQILFRHIEELNNIQNVNLGWFAFEQADELATSNEFFLLFGRLRRQVEPDATFKEFGMPERSGFVIGNAGDHWGRELWKEGKLEDSECIEATTLDNADVLPKDFIDSLMVLKKQRPELYAQYVMNDWTVTTDQRIIIRNSDLEKLRDLIVNVPQDKYLISLDPSSGGDECVYKVFKNTEEIDMLVLHERDTMKVVGAGLVLSARHKIDDFIVDSIGMGKPIADRLSEAGKRVIHNNVAKEARNKERFGNLKSEQWWYVMEQVLDCKVHFPADDLTRKQISSVRYVPAKSGGRIWVEPKDDTKKTLGSSPDRADCWIQGIWGLQFVQPRNLKDQYRRNRVEDYQFNPATV